MPEINLRYHPQALSTLYFEMRSLIGTYRSPVRLGWLDSEPEGPSGSIFPVLGLLVHTTTLGIFCGC